MLCELEVHDALWYKCRPVPLPNSYSARRSSERVARAHDYVDVLKSEFEARCRRNPHYSLRAFGRDIGLLSSRLSDILHRKQGLSSQKAALIAQRLGFDELESRWFVTLVNSARARSRAKRLAAERTLQELRKESAYFTLRSELFTLVSDWYHFPILELTTLDDFVADRDWIARKLGITPIQAERAVERLLSLGLLQRRKNNKLVAATTFPKSTDDIPSLAIQNAHQQMLEKAARALHFQDVSKREFSANVMAIDPADIPRIKEEIRNFRRDLEKRYKQAPHKKAVYCFSTQLFSLTEAGKHD